MLSLYLVRTVHAFYFICVTVQSVHIIAVQLRSVADPGLNFGGGTEGMKVRKVRTFATELAKHSVQQRETTAIYGGGEFPLCPTPGSVTDSGRLSLEPLTSTG